MLCEGVFCKKMDSLNLCGEKVSEVVEKGNVESSHETVSSGGVQGKLGRGLAVMPPSDASCTLSSSSRMAASFFSERRKMAAPFFSERRTLSFSSASPMSEVVGIGNVESSHETVSSGGVQGRLGRGLPVMPPSDVSGILSSFSASPVSEVVDIGNVESSHDSVSSGGVQGRLGRGLPVMPPSDASGILSSSSRMAASF